MPLLEKQLHRKFTLAEKIKLSLEIAGSYCRARWWVRRRTIEDALAAARTGSAGPPDMSPADVYRLAFRLGRVVERGLNHLPGDTRCLTRSLVLVRLLARRGIPTRLVIGVKPQPFAAHAWVEYEREPLLNPAGYESGRLIDI